MSYMNVGFMTDRWKVKKTPSDKPKVKKTKESKDTKESNKVRLIQEDNESGGGLDVLDSLGDLYSLIETIRNMHRNKVEMDEESSFLTALNEVVDKKDVESLAANLEEVFESLTGSEEDYEDSMTDVEADADTLASAGYGTDEDYGYYGGDEY